MWRSGINFITLIKVHILSRHHKDAWGPPSLTETGLWRNHSLTPMKGIWLSSTVCSPESTWSSPPPWSLTWVQNSLSLSTPRLRLRSGKDSLIFDIYCKSQWRLLFQNKCCSFECLTYALPERLIPFKATMDQGPSYHRGCWDHVDQTYRGLFHYVYYFQANENEFMQK